VGSEVVGVKKNDDIYYDKHAGHGVEIDKEVLQIIKLQDVVIVL
jgi:co-chaperonin GroES (HSP10)